MGLQPNILIVMADQLTPRALPAYGNLVARTPHIDALARSGVVFDAAYCNTPLCAPSRAVFMTGRLPSATGVYDNAAEFAAHLPTLAHYLRHAGYRCILAGKMHFCGPDQLHGFEERLTTDIYPADFGWTPDWTHPEHRPDWYHSMTSVTEAGPCVRTNQLDFDDAVIASTRQKLFDIARASASRPFCMVVSLTHPHDPFTIPEPYWSRIGAADMPRVRTAPPDPHSQRLLRVCGLDLLQPTEQQIADARRAYYGAIAYVDDQLGVLRDTLAVTGLTDNTIVVLLSDHGEMLGERGLWFKMNFFEPACRIPLIIHAPGRFATHRVAQSVSLADMLPTLVDLGQGHADYAAPLDGRSLLAHLQGSGGHDEVIGEYLAEGAIAPVVMIRRGVEKFIHSPADPDLLFDLIADPDEVNNLAQTAPQAARIAEYRQEVGRRWSLDRLHEDVIASQSRRILVDGALRLGGTTAWDYQPVQDASRMYVRNTMKLDDLEAMARFPRPGVQ